mmetsp:Transcript_32605/g.47021  ORF Transcript_32605/g.47021 Transcript_32605/m.47021 type:complete len:223 (+) Transcript_32605:504-1172(+)
MTRPTRACSSSRIPSRTYLSSNRTHLTTRSSSSNRIYSTNSFTTIRPAKATARVTSMNHPRLRTGPDRNLIPPMATEKEWAFRGMKTKTSVDSHRNIRVVLRAVSSHTVHPLAQGQQQAPPEGPTADTTSPHNPHPTLLPIRIPAHTTTLIQPTITIITTLVVMALRRGINPIKKTTPTRNLNAIRAKTATVPPMQTVATPTRRKKQWNIHITSPAATITVC